MYQGKEYIDFLGLNQFDFHSRSYNSWIGRFDQIDGANQFASGYTGMGNNPVSGIDPDGQWVHIAVGAAVGGVANLASNWKNINGNFWKGLGYFGIGAAAGALGAGVGAGVNVAIAGGSFGAGFMGTASGVASTGFFSGAATGASAGFSNGFVSGTGNSLIQGNSFGSSLGSGFKTGRKQGFIGGATGGVFSGINAMSKNLNFWNGTATLDLSNGVGAHGVVPMSEEISGKYVGNFEGVDVYESSLLGISGEGGYAGGITLPGRGITVGKYAFSKKLDMQLVAHEFGHTKQIEQLGALGFLNDIGLPSISSANRSGVNGWRHSEFWTEVWANRLANDALQFSKQFTTPWNTVRFPLNYKNHNDILNVLRLFKK